MTNEAFAGVKIDARLAAQGRNTRDTHAIHVEVTLPGGAGAGKTRSIAAVANV